MILNLEKILADQNMRKTQDLDFDGDKKEEEPEEEEEDEDEEGAEKDPFAKLPVPENWIEPRLFYITNENTGYEFLNEKQLRLFF